MIWGVGLVKSEIARLTTELAALDAVAGFEHKVIARMADGLRALGLPTEIDHFGNLIASKRGTRGSPTAMVAAHADEIGAIVKSVDARGFLRFEKLGGTQDVMLLGRKVAVNGVLGVVGVKAGHLQWNGAALPRHSDMYIDIGADSAAEVAAMGIRIGDPIAYVGEVRSLGNGDRLCGKAIDNRIGCAVLLQLAAELRAVDLPGTVHFVVNTQEEVGWRGIQLVANRLKPDAALVVDTMPSGDTPDTDLERELGVRIGAGPVVTLMNGTFGSGHIMHAGMKRLLLGLAEAEGLPHQVAVYGGIGSDATTLHLVGEGIPTGIVNIPRRYAHSPVEVVDLNDAVNALHLLRVATLALATETVGWE